MIRFYVIALGGNERGYDSLEEANARAAQIRRRGYHAFVEARDADADLPFVPPARICRAIRWAGVAP